MLSAAAETCGEMAVVQVCQQNLREEVAMAEWMHNHLGSTTKEFIARGCETRRGQTLKPSGCSDARLQPNCCKACSCSMLWCFIASSFRTSYSFRTS
ncbi:DUF892 family protein [Aminobacter niigataensis]|uniref:DUF892 family protein n=1 Tax=Aminobacter niigataensis TaxID=83265 RepID=UPI001FE5FF75|nr:DUF892 family protein [Aminobacter niigataensis]